MHITPPVTVQEYDGSHHPRYADWYIRCMEILERIKMEQNEPEQVIIGDPLDFKNIEETWSGPKP